MRPPCSRADRARAGPGAVRPRFPRRLRARARSRAASGPAGRAACSGSPSRPSAATTASRAATSTRPSSTSSPTPSRPRALIQPVLVRKDGDGYRLIAGERRWRAAQLRGPQGDPALVREATDAEAFELALVENLQRADLNPIEEAEGYRRLSRSSSSPRSRSASAWARTAPRSPTPCACSALPDEVKELVADGALDMGHARALLGVPRCRRWWSSRRRWPQQKLSVRDTEKLVQQAHAEEGAGREARPSRAPRCARWWRSCSACWAPKCGCRSEPRGKGPWKSTSSRTMTWIVS